MDSYTITYGFFILQCDGSVEATGIIMETNINSSLRMYTQTELEEDTIYDITIVAVNGAGSSSSSNELTTRTGTAGDQFISVQVVILDDLYS